MSAADRRALLRRAAIMRHLARDHVLEPLDALAFAVWPTPLVTDLLDGLTTPVLHGTLSGYKRGCDCVPCRQAKRAWDRARPSRVAA